MLIAKARDRGLLQTTSLNKNSWVPLKDAGGQTDTPTKGLGPLPASFSKCPLKGHCLYLTIYFLELRSDLQLSIFRALSPAQIYSPD